MIFIQVFINYIIFNLFAYYLFIHLYIYIWKINSLMDKSLCNNLFSTKIIYLFYIILYYIHLLLLIVIYL